MKKAQQFCLMLMTVFALFICGCSPSNTPTASTTLKTTQTENTTPKAPEAFHLSYVMMHHIAENYAFSCWGVEFEEDETVPYEKIFNYFFFYEGIYTFDQKMLSDVISPYYCDDTNTIVIPHKIVDDYLEQRFQTVADPERIDMLSDELYDSETGCYTVEIYPMDMTGEEMDIDRYNVIELRDNVYQFKARYFTPDAPPEELVYCSTFTVELNKTGYRILAHKQTEEEPTGQIMALREYYIGLCE